MARFRFFLLLLFLPSVVFSAEGGGMPQLDISTYLSQGFWLVLCFGLLFLVMSKVALPRVSEVLNLRDSKIRHDLETAEKLKSEAESLQAKIEENLASARAESQETLRRATEKAAKYTASATEKTDKSINNTLAEALENISQAKAKAIKDIDSAVASTASVIVRKLADIDVNESSVSLVAKKVQ